MKSKILLEVDAAAYFLITVQLLFLPLIWILVVWCSISVHELSHLAAAAILRQPVRRIRLSYNGIRMTILYASPKTAFLCAAAGPAASILLGIFLHPFISLYYIPWIHFLVSILPFPALDGGAMLSALRIWHTKPSNRC